MASIRGPRDLCTLDEVKRFLPSYTEPTDPAEKTRADTLLADLIKSASQRGYEVSGREFLSHLDPGDTTSTGGSVWPAAPSETRKFDTFLNPLTPGGGKAAAVLVGDMVSYTAVSITPTWNAAAQPWQLDLPTRVIDQPRPRAPWEPIRRLHVLGGVYDGQTFSVTGIWGFPKVPDDIRLATAEQAAIWAGRDLATFSRTFLEAAAAGAGATEPRALARSVYDTFFLYRIPSV